MKTVEDYIKEMKDGNVHMFSECTFKEYVSEMTRFQSNICKIIAGDAYYDKMRVNEALYIMETNARKKELRSNPAVCNGVLAMKKVEKEMAITMSGVKGENIVSKTLEYLNRPNTQIFRNVYVTDGINETELDDIVLTDSGIIILEVKNVKSDLTLTEDGRMVFTGDECHDNIPLADKMALKRRLLKKCLEKSLNEKGLNIPIYIDSFIVFSAPKSQYINIDDRCHREKYCYRSCLNRKIENYLGCAYYKEDELSHISEIFSAMESNVKRFKSGLNYEEVCRNLAEALVVLQNEESDYTAEKSYVAGHKDKKVVNLNSKNHEQKKTEHNTHRLGYAVACACVGILVSGIVTLTGIGTRQI